MSHVVLVVTALSLISMQLSLTNQVTKRNIISDLPSEICEKMFHFIIKNHYKRLETSPFPAAYVHDFNSWLRNDGLSLFSAELKLYEVSFYDIQIVSSIKTYGRSKIV